MGKVENLEAYVLIFIGMGILVGFLSRWWMLRGDIRQYPTLPNGYLIHLIIGFIAAAIGSIAYPAILDGNYVAVTFLVLAIQQFRDVRKMEKDTLVSLEKECYAPRGESYINGIAKTFEARNYIVMVSSLTTTVSAFIIRSFTKSNWFIIPTAVVIGFIITTLLRKFTKGNTLEDIVTLEKVSLNFKDEFDLYAGDILIENIDLSKSRERILNQGIGLIIRPKGDGEKIILNHGGQIKAILHECTRLLGLEGYANIKRNFDTGELGLVIVPIVKDMSRLKKIILSVPILEVNIKNEG